MRKLKTISAKKWRARSLLSSVACVILAIIICIPANAVKPQKSPYLPTGREDEFSENNLVFYDPNGGDGCDYYSYGTSKPSGDQITWIGDSYTVRAEDMYDHQISKKMPGIDVSKRQSGKRFGFEDGTNTGGPNGLQIVNDMLKNGEQIRKFVIFALGANDPVFNESYIDDLVAALGNDRTIILVTPLTTANSYTEHRRIMNAAKSKYSNIIVADFASEMEKKDNWKSLYDTKESPAIHLLKDSSQFWVDTIYDALPGGVGLLPGNTNEEKIWNYFASLSDVPAVSGDPAVIAGIMGNFSAESSFDPFVDDGCSGLYQVCSSSGYRQQFLSTVNAAVGGGYWHASSVKGRATQDKVDIAIRSELDYLVEKFGDHGGMFKNAPNSFVNRLNVVSQKTPEAYAELFMVIIENCYGGSGSLLDSGVKSIASHSTYQAAGKRRSEARRIYDAYFGKSSTAVATSSVASAPSSNSGSSGGTGVKWDDEGWLITETFPNATIEDGRQIANDGNWRNNYSTPDHKPNKIVLHSTEGTSTGLSAYGGNPYPPHFTIDFRSKSVAQHFPIDKPSVALYGGDTAGGIQIEIVGVCDLNKDNGCDDPSEEELAKGNWPSYYIYAYSENDWDYLAVLLAAIAERTGIPLTSSVDWGRSKLSDEEFLNYSGIISHRQAPYPNNHDDPGKIWKYVEAAIARNPSASKFRYGTGSKVCPTDTATAGLTVGGMTKEQAEQTILKDYNALPSSQYAKYGITESGCAGGWKSNCVSASKYFVNRFDPSLTSTITSLGNGRDVARTLISKYGYSESSTPVVYSIFSVAKGTTVCSSTGQLCGHTGVVVGITESGKVITFEAGCSSTGSGGWVSEHDPSYFAGGTFAYTNFTMEN